MQVIDFRSDIVTQPTPEMRRAMYRAEVANDSFGEDPTVNRLQELAAERMGTEASLFVSSGTQGNLLALLSVVGKGGSVVAPDYSHLETGELNGFSYLAEATITPTVTERGVMIPEEVRASLEKTAANATSGRLVWVENTHNLGGGTVTSPVTMSQIVQLAGEALVPIHLDGSRIFNAATFLHVDPSELVNGVTTVQFCLSKGLGAPVGSMLCGPKDVIEKAFHFRQMVGGQMRQVGIIAAAGIVALEKMTLRLQDDHDNAKALAQGLAKIAGILIDSSTVQTNIVFCSLEPSIGSAEDLNKSLRARGVLAMTAGAVPNSIRFVTHYQISSSDVNVTLRRVEEAVEFITVANKTPATVILSRQP